MAFVAFGAGFFCFFGVSDAFADFFAHGAAATFFHLGLNAAVLAGFATHMTTPAFFARFAFFFAAAAIGISAFFASYLATVFAFCTRFNILFAAGFGGCFAAFSFFCAAFA
ncbi:MAG: hypothetical protein ACD_39C01085G0002 [uncultured bacterium]|nr:MAG: hypothetical protein ACD_39C01085G0002 [uncultured bacterium]